MSVPSNSPSVSGLYCSSACSSQVKVYTTKFTVTSADVSGTLASWWSSFDSSRKLNINTRILSNPIFNYPNCITTTQWQIVASTIFAPLNVDPARLCNVKVVNINEGNVLTGIKIIYTILPPPSVSPSYVTNPNAVSLNKLSARCLGKYVEGFLNQYNRTDTNTQPGLYYANSVANTIRDCSDGFTPEINYNIEKFTSTSEHYRIPGSIRFINISEDKQENYASVSGATGVSVIEDPSTIWEYLFMFSFLFSFVGAIFYGVTYIINVDPAYIVANKTAALALNIYISCCSIISLFVWFNIDNPILVSSVLNPSTVKYTLN
jgi:hypothetical protein